MEAQRKETKQIVVVGAGNWVKMKYAPALKPYRQRNECGLYFVYDTSYAAKQGLSQDQVDKYNRYTRENVEEFESWGATCLDWADESNRARLRIVSPYAVFVVTADNTHCDVAEEWIDRAQNIFVEKPFDIDPERIRRLRRNISSSGIQTVIKGFDHYLVRANQFKKMGTYLGLNEHLEGEIHEFRFHMLESLDRGMVERAASVQSGLVLDMGSHTPALVWPFGDPNTIRLDSIKAGIYEPNPEKGVTTSGREIMKSGLETFAEIKFTFTSIFGGTVKATACVGKCVGMEDEKYVEVIGGRNRDRKVKLDLSNSIVDFTGGTNPGPVTSLFPEPVLLLVREVMLERASESLALFDPEIGQDITARLKEWQYPIIDYTKDEKNLLPGYKARAPLNDILAGLSSI